MKTKRTSFAFTLDPCVMMVDWSWGWGWGWGCGWGCGCGGGGCGRGGGGVHIGGGHELSEGDGSGWP